LVSDASKPDFFSSGVIEARLKIEGTMPDERERFQNSFVINGAIVSAPTGPFLFKFDQL
jgi:hypothetical protein